MNGVQGVVGSNPAVPIRTVVSRGPATACRRGASLLSGSRWYGFGIGFRGRRFDPAAPLVRDDIQDVLAGARGVLGRDPRLVLAPQKFFAAPARADGSSGVPMSNLVLDVATCCTVLQCLLRHLVRTLEVVPCTRSPAAFQS